VHSIHFWFLKVIRRRDSYITFSEYAIWSYTLLPAKVNQNSACQVTSGPACNQPTSQPAAPYGACAINSNAINSTGLGYGKWPRQTPWPILAAASELAVAEQFGLYMQVSFLTNVISLVSTTPIDIKSSKCFARGLYASAYKISPSYDTAFRRR